MARKPRKVFFFHIPKCAGMSIWRVLRSLYQPDDLFQIGTFAQQAEFDRMTVEKRMSLSVIGGHGYLQDMVKELPDLKKRYCITSFREPIARIVSEYNFIRRTPHHHNFETVSRMVDLGEYLPLVHNNMQTELLCGVPDHRLALKAIDRVFDDWRMIDDLDQLIAGVYRNARLDAAKTEPANIGEHTFSVDMIDATTMERLRRLNAADLALFDSLKDRLAAGFVRKGVLWLTSERKGLRQLTSKIQSIFP